MLHELPVSGATCSRSDPAARPPGPCRCLTPIRRASETPIMPDRGHTFGGSRSGNRSLHGDRWLRPLCCYLFDYGAPNRVPAAPRATPDRDHRRNFRAARRAERPSTGPVRRCVLLPDASFGPTGSALRALLKPETTHPASKRGSGSTRHSSVSSGRLLALTISRCSGPGGSTAQPTWSAAAIEHVALIQRSQPTISVKRSISLRVR